MPQVSPLVLELRAQIEEGRAKLWKRGARKTAIAPWLDEHSRLIDGVLERITDAAWDHVRATREHCDTSPDDLVLIAIGGYGRAELCPYSDIDIAFVPAEEDDACLDAVIKEAFRLIIEVLMDGAKLDVGYAYRPLSDIARLDHPSKAALLEARHISGSRKLAERVRQRVYATWDAVEFILEKAAERRERSSDVGLSQYAVEPNLKEGTGALRDIQFALWSAAALLKTDEPLAELVLRGVVTQTAATQIIEARDFFLQLRVWLHLTSERKTDVLRLQYQDRAARAFNYTGANGQAAQKLLADYYYHAENAARFCDRVLEQLLEGPLNLDSHFVAVRQSLAAAHPYTLVNHPELLLTPFSLARQYGFTLDPDLSRDLDDELLNINDDVRRHPAMRRSFFDLISDMGNVAGILTELRGRGVLQAMIPEVGAMLHLAPPDPTHELTVGEHSIAAVRQLDNLWWKRRKDDALAALWSGVNDHELLVLATLLHDVGKIEPGTDHSVSGEKIGARIGERLGLSAARLATLKILIRRHLVMPRSARLHDLSAPATIRRVIGFARDVPTLKMLYLLSMADTMSVGERTYSALDLSSMRELYDRCLLAMTRAETAEVLTDMEKREQLVQQERERFRRQLRHLDLDDGTLQKVSDTLPASYILNTPMPTMATHLKFLDDLPEEKLIVDFYPMPDHNVAEMTVVAYDDDKPGLLSRLCGVVHAANAEIVGAQVYTLEGAALNSKWSKGAPGNGKDVVVDRLDIMSNGRNLGSSQTAKLAATLREVLVGDGSLDEVLKSAGKKVSQSVVPIRVGAQNDLSDEHTVISIVCNNIPGLLYHTSRAVAALGLDIHTAKVTTWGGQAEDSFYVTKRGDDGSDVKVPDNEIKVLLEELGKKLVKPAKTNE